MKTRQMPPLHPRQVFLEWYHFTTLGQIFQATEASYLQSSLKLTYNQNTLQVGVLGSENAYIGEEFRRGFVLISPFSTEIPQRTHTEVIHANPDELPIASSSVDVLILAHVIEFESNRHQVLREVERVLKPEGRLFILAMNPWSIHGLLQYLPRRDSFWHTGFVSSHRLLDWLNLLQLEAEFSAAFSLSSACVLRKPDTLPAKFRAQVSFAYAIKAIKRRYLMIPMEPSWMRAPSLAAGHMFDTLR